MPDRQALGREAEDRAAAYLSQHGMTLIDRNYHCRGGEIDLILLDQEQLVFVEVRYRSNNTFGSAVESVNPRKQQRLILAAQNYLLKYPQDRPCRFDVVGIDAGGKTHWIRNAFQD